MTLQVELTTRLNLGAILTGLTDELTGATGDLGGVDLAIDGDALGASASASASIDLGPLGDTAAALGADIGNIVGDLPVAGDLIGPIQAGIDTLNALLAADLATDFAGALDRTAAELQALEGGTTLSGLKRLAEVLGRDGDFGAILSALEPLLQLSGGTGRMTTGIGDIAAAVFSFIEAIGGMMTLETMLGEAHRLGLVVEQQMPAGGFQALIEQQASRATLARAALDGLDVADDAAVDAAFDALAEVRGGTRVMVQTMTQAMAFGEATLTYADPAALVARTEEVLQGLRGTATAEVEAAATRLADLLGPTLSIDVSGAPQMSLETLLTDVEARAAELAGEIATLDLGPITDPLTNGLGAIAGLTEDISSALDEAIVTVETALGQVRDAVRALPLEQVAEKLREVVGVIADVLTGLTDLLAGIEGTIGDAAGAANTAIQRAEGAVDEFDRAMTAAFDEASAFIDGLGLDTALGQVADGIQKVADVIGQADMAPYFDTAEEAISSTASVIDKVPFELLPDEMEQDLVDLIRPIKTADAQAFRQEILTVLQIDEDGEFAVRDELVAAVAEIQAQFDELVTAMQALDPRSLAQTIDEALDTVRSEIETVAPEAELRPLTEALDQAKALVAGLDLTEVLAPLSDGFDQVLAQIDAFRPGELIAPLDAEVDALRTSFLEATMLEEWQGKLDQLREQALGYVDLLDPTQLEEPLRAAFDDAERRLSEGELPDLLAPLGAMVGALMAGGGEAVAASAIEQVKQWLRGSAGAGDRLTLLAQRFSTAVAAAKREVESVDPNALAVTVQADATALVALVETLPAGAARDRLAGAAGALDLSADLRLIGPPHGDFLAFLGRAEALAQDLAAKGFGEVDAVSGVLRAAMAPLMPLFDAPKGILEKLGFTHLRDGLPGLLSQLFAVATPERLAGLLMPLFSALHARIEALLDAILQPMRDAIDNVIEVVNLFDLTRLSDALDDIHVAIRDEIAVLHPNDLLAEPIAAFEGAQTAVADFDPLGPIIATIDTLKATVLRVLDKLDGDALLAVPIELYDTLMGLLQALDINALLTPLYDRLDAIAGQVSDGLEGTVGAFEDLQDALPGQVGSTSISGSASVSVGG